MIWDMSDGRFWCPSCGDMVARDTDDFTPEECRAVVGVMGWTNWSEAPPEAGQKIVIVCNDGCSSSLALMSDDGPLDGECGEVLPMFFTDGAIWTALPETYPLGFMEEIDDDRF